MAWQYVALAAAQIFQGAQQANAVQKQAELSKQIDSFNIEQSEYDAYLAEQDGYSTAARYQNVIDTIDSQQRVQYIAADVDPNFGTAKDLQNDNQVTGALNILDIQSQAHKRALGFKQETNKLKLQSELNAMGSKSQAESMLASSALGASGTLITGYERNNAPASKKPTGSTGGHFGGSAVNYSVDENSYNVQYGGGLGRIS